MSTDSIRMSTPERRRDDLETERRIATLEEQHRNVQVWRDDIARKVDLSNAKMDLMLEAVHMAKGGWWAAGKITGLLLGVLSGLGMVASGVYWAYQHLSFKPAVAVAVLTISAYFKPL